MALTTTQVTSLLENILFETPTQAAAAAPGWVSMSALGAYSTMSAMGSALAATPEAGIAQAVARLYLGVLGRTPDAAGLGYWVQYLEQGMTTAQVQSGAYTSSSHWTSLIASFTGSTEFATNYPNVAGNPAAFVTLLYQNVLGRAPDASGYAYWTGQLATTGMTSAAMGAMVQNFTNATEFVSDSATAITNSLVTYASALAGGNSATLGTMVPTPSATPVALTTGIDALVLSNGNNAISGTANGTGATFGAGDSINGGSTTGNSLSVSDLGSLGTWTVTGPASPTVSGIQTATFSSNEAVTANTTTGYSGLTQLTVNSTGADNITAAATTNVTVSSSAAVTVNGGLAVNATTSGAAVTIGATTAPAGAITVSDSSQAANAIAVDGGTSVTITSTGANFATAATADITVGAATAPTGAVSITTTTGTANGNTIGKIAVTGGTTVAVTENAGDTTANDAVNMGNVKVTGTTATTAVTVNQAAAAAATAAVTAVAGIVGVTGVTAAPGVQGVTAVTAVGAVSAVAGVVGVTDGTIDIADSVATNSTTAAAANVAGGTISSVSLTNFGAANISSPALSTLTLGGTGAAVNLYEGGTAAATHTTLTINANGLSGTSVVDNSNQFTTLDVVTGGSAKSTLASVTDTSLTTLNVSGTQKLTLSAITPTLTTVAVSGSAGFSDGATTHTTGLAGQGATLTSFTTTSSGVISVALDDTHQSFTGSTGQDIITISALADATKTITAGSATNNELILEGGAYALTSATAAKVTGFQTVGVAANVTGTIDMSVLDSHASTLDIIGNSTITFSKVAAQASINLDANSTSVTVGYADANGAADAVTVNIGSSTNAAAITAAALSVADANSVGIGTLNIVSNDSAFNSANVITTLTDNGLANLNVSGNGGLTINTLNEATTQATSFVLNNTETGAAGVTIANFTDNNLGSLTFKGTNASTITTLNDTGHVISLANTGSSTATVGTLNDATITTLNLGAGVALGVNSATLGTEAASGLQSANNVGVTVAGSADHAHVVVNLTAGAAAGNTDAITLGNGNDYVIDASTAGTVNVTVGTGSNLIVLGGTTTNTTGAYNITLGTHSSTTGIDSITVGTGGTSYATAVNYTITGAVTGDHITLAADATAAGTGTSNAVTAVTAGGTLAATITALETAVTGAGNAHHVFYSQYGSDTYIVDSASGTLAATDTTIVKVAGLHTFTATGGVVTLAS